MARETFVLDTSAVLALRGDESGADQVEALLVRAKNKSCRLLISFMTRMEILYLTRREESEAAANEAILLLDSFPIECVTCEPDILKAAAILKAEGGLSLADSWIAATCIVRDAVLVHKDPEFSALEQIPQKMLAS